MVQQLESAGVEMENARKARDAALKELDEMKDNTKLLKENFKKKLEEKSS